MSLPRTDSAPVRATRRAIANPGGVSAAMRLVIFVSGLLLVLVAPVVIQGGLLADDYVICVRPVRDGYTNYLDATWRDAGLVRPARFVELLLISATCKSVPFGLAMLVPLAFKFTVGFLLLGFLRDLHMPSPWPEIGTAVWLLEPVGTEAALWPAALHVSLGLSLGLAALRLYRRGWFGLATLASVGAALSVEQIIFALPFAVWLTTPPGHQRRAAAIAASAMMTIVLMYAIWPGENERHALTLGQRWQNIWAKREWYVFFPAAGLGLYSGSLAFLWALPFSVAIALGGAFAGGMIMPRLLPRFIESSAEPHGAIRIMLAGALLILLVNVPLIVTEVGYSARTFTPTWLVLSGVLALGAAQVRWRQIRLVGVVSGTAAAFAVLSLALSVSVRLRTDTFNRAAAHWIADRTHDGAIVAVCDMDRTIVRPAPLGSFHLHAFHSASGDWIEYLTGRVVQVRRSGERYWGSRCPDLRGADLVVSFPALVAELLPPEP